MESPKIFCSSCRCYRPANDFNINKLGKKLKTCSKHSKKRVLPELDQWDSFLHEIKTWSQPGQTKQLDIFYTFDLDQLPVNFGHSLVAKSDSALDVRQFNQAIGQIVDIIRDAGDHRFRQLRSTKDPNPKYYYCCCQDSSKIFESKRAGKRDRRQMSRFPCNSSLKIQLDLSNRRMTLTLRHIYHIPYGKNELPSEAEMKEKANQIINEEELEKTDRRISCNEMDDIVSSMTSILHILKEQKEIGNTKFLEAFKAKNTDNLILLAEIQQRKNQNTLPWTWTQNKHPAMMYYK